MVDTILFDFDGTLFDTETMNKTCYKEVAYNWKLKDFEKVFHECLGVNSEREMEIYQEYYGADFDYYSFINEVKMLTDSYIATYGIELKTGAREVVSNLFEDYKLGVVSSSPTTYLLKLLESKDMLDYFDFVVSGDGIKDGKPSPKIYLEACKNHSISPENCVALEDSINGVLSAYNAGLKTIMVVDLVEPNDKVKKLPISICDNLFQAEVLIRTGLKERINNE